MFYRRKILLSLLQTFGNKLGKIDLQKLLFIFMQQKREKREYDFIPYMYGCYSYSAVADLTAMVAQNLLTIEKNFFKKNDANDYISLLNERDKNILQYVKNNFGSMKTNDLMRYVYAKFPYYAIKSVEAAKILTKQELKKVEQSNPKNRETILYTIGYEGISLEEYLNRLIQNDIKILIDVRNNPISMKFGFSKNQLNNYCKNLGIQYTHIPALGIQSEQRRELNSQKDYDNLFADYCKNTLNETEKEQEHIFEILKINKHIALTCFEKDINQCHRKHLANAIEKLPNFSYEVRHI
jgi:uncharacterized protein (DUF488 family)